jgi:hypothetical protein
VFVIIQLRIPCVFRILKLLLVSALNRLLNLRFHDIFEVLRRLYSRLNLDISRILKNELSAHGMNLVRTDGGRRRAAFR